MMQRFTLLLLVASLAFLGAVVPVGATRLVKRETNAPLTPVKRSRTDTAKRSQVAQRESSPIFTGTLQVQNQNGTILGSVFNAATGPTGINPVSSNPTVPNLVVDFENGNLEALEPNFSPPYLGATDATLTMTPQGQDLLLVKFINVAEGAPVGSQSDIWSIESTSGGLSLSATWTNSDQSEVALDIVYDPSKNELSFTETPEAISSPWTPVSLYLVQAQ